MIFESAKQSPIEALRAERRSPSPIGKGDEEDRLNEAGASQNSNFQAASGIKSRNNKQKYFYSGKKKRHTLKSQVVVDKKSKKVICTSFGNGKKHDFRLFKESNVRWTKERFGITDSGYTGIKKLQNNTKLPKKSSKKKPLTKEEKEQNRKISSERVVNENVIGSLKRFKIINDRYKNRKKEFGLRFNLIAGIHNMELTP